MLLIKDKFNKMEENGERKLIFFLAPKVDLVKQVGLTNQGVPPMIGGVNFQQQGMERGEVVAFGI